MSTINSAEHDAFMGIPLSNYALVQVSARNYIVIDLAGGTSYWHPDKFRHRSIRRISDPMPYDKARKMIIDLDNGATTPDR